MALERVEGSRYQAPVEDRGGVVAVAPKPARKFVPGTADFGKFAAIPTGTPVYRAGTSYDARGMGILRNARALNLGACVANRSGIVSTIYALATEEPPTN